MTQTNMISFKQAHANESNSYNKPFTIRTEQIFRCSLKTTQLIKIKHYLQRNSKLCCYHLKSKKRRIKVDFIANKYKKCLYVHYQKQLYVKVKLTRGKYCQDIVIKKREFCYLILQLLPKWKFFWNLGYFYMNTNIQGDFQICISVPLTF